jgi:hypothetical protein
MIRKTMPNEGADINDHELPSIPAISPAMTPATQVGEERIEIFQKAHELRMEPSPFRYFRPNVVPYSPLND